MTSFLSSIILPIAVGAVAIVLLLGLVNMVRGGSPHTSQKLMRLRVLLQFVAIVIAMAGGLGDGALAHVRKSGSRFSEQIMCKP